MSVFSFTVQNGDVAVINGKYYTSSQSPVMLTGADGDFFYVRIFSDKPPADLPFGRHLLPVNGIIAVDNGIRLFGGLIAVVRDDFYEIRYVAETVDDYRSPVALAQQKAYYRNSPHTVTVYTDCAARIMIESEGEVFTKDLDCRLTDAEIASRASGAGLLITVTGNAQGKKYLLIILYDGLYRTVFERLCDGLSFAEDGFFVTDKKPDMLGREITRKFRYKNDAFCECEKTYRYNHLISYPLALLPCLFMEAMQTDDYDLARTYLSDDLKDRILALREFIGPFTDFSCQDSDSGFSKVIYTENVTARRGVFVCRKIKFSLKDDKIYNVDVSDCL